MLVKFKFNCKLNVKMEEKSHIALYELFKVQAIKEVSDFLGHILNAFDWAQTKCICFSSVMPD